MINLRKAATGALAAGLISLGALAASPASAATSHPTGPSSAPQVVAAGQHLSQSLGTVQPNAGNSGGTVYDPNGHRVYGTAANGNPGQCPYYSFCIWTGTNMSGTMFALPHCGEYDIYHWLGAGSWANDQTPGTRAHLYGSNYSYWAQGADPDGFYFSPNYDFYPVDHIRPC